MPSHHLDDLVLLDYAAGSLSEPLALLVATHLTLCPLCRAKVVELESIGAAMLLEQEVQQLNRQEPDWARLSRLECELPVSPPRGAGAVEPLIPRPLRDYVGDDLDRLRWNRPLRGIQEYVLAAGEGGAKTALMRIEPGRMMPRHTHMGGEYTLVLQGGFSDERGTYLRGDVTWADPEVTHRPVADDHEACLCLTVVDAPLQLTGPIGWLVNPFLRR